MVSLKQQLDRIDDIKLRREASIDVVVNATKDLLSWNSSNLEYRLIKSPYKKDSPKDKTRKALITELTVTNKNGELIFKDRIQFWDGTPLNTKRNIEDPLRSLKEQIEDTVKTVTKNYTVPRVVNQPGTVSVFYSSVQGEIESSSNTYALAKEGTGAGFTASTDSSGGSSNIGQAKVGPTYFCWEFFTQFDTSAITDTDVVTDAVFEPFCISDFSTTDFTLRARLYDWGASLTTADWRTTAQLAALTLAATCSSTEGGGTLVFTQNGTNLEDNISKTGSTYLVVSSSLHESSTTPIGSEYMALYFVTSTYSKLTVTHVDPDAELTVGTATASASTGEPTFQVSTPEFNVGTATATAQAHEPTFTLSFLVGVATATAEAPVNEMYGAFGLSPGTATASILTNEPSFIYDVSISPEVATASVGALEPTFTLTNPPESISYIVIEHPILSATIPRISDGLHTNISMPTLHKSLKLNT